MKPCCFALQYLAQAAPILQGCHHIYCLCSATEYWLVLHYGQVMILKTIRLLWDHELYYFSFCPYCYPQSSSASTLIFCPIRILFLPKLILCILMQYYSFTCGVWFWCQWKSRCETLLWCQKSEDYGISSWWIPFIVLHQIRFIRGAFSSQEAYLIFCLTG